MADFSYIVLDLEWNQPLNPDSAIREPFFFDSEIIEIGALRLDERFRETGSFKTFIRPRFYPHMNGDVVQLTKIRAQDLEKAPEFPRAYAEFMEWCGEDCCLCTWGPDDIPVLMDNLLMHGMDAEMPCCYDLQRIFGHEIMRDDRQCSLERAMELLKLTPDRAHDALNDARQNKNLERGRKTTKQRADRKDDDAQLENAHLAAHVTQAAKRQHSHARRKQIHRAHQLNAVEAHAQLLLHHGQRHGHDGRIQTRHKRHDEHGKQNRPFVLAMGVALKGNALAAQLLCGLLHIYPFEWRNTKTEPQSPANSRDWGPAYGIGT